MGLEKLNRASFIVCMICLAVGTSLTLAMIWMDFGFDTPPWLWRFWVTAIVLFSASALTLAISKVFESNTESSEE